MRAPIHALLAALATVVVPVGCAAQTTQRGTVLVDPMPPVHGPQDPQRVLSDPLPGGTQVVQSALPAGSSGPSPSIGSAPGLRPQIVAQWSRTDLVPFQSWIELPGSVVGIVWMAGLQPWGAGYEHSATASANTSRDEYKFGVDGTSPYAVYFQSDGRGYNFLRNWSGGGRGAFDAAMFDRDTPNMWGLSRRAHVVEVDVNARQGAPGGVHFVVTNARVLDGSSAFPPRADDVLVTLRQRFDAVLADERRELDGLYATATRSVGGSYTFGTAATEPVGVFPTWRRDAQAIEVVFTSGMSAQGTGPTTTEVSDCPVCPPGAPCMECNPHQLQLRQTATVKVGFAIRYRVDARGLVVAETRYAGRVEIARAARRSNGRERGDDF